LWELGESTGAVYPAASPIKRLMSNIEHWQLTHPTDLPAYGNSEIASGAAFHPIIENLMLFALFAGCAGFWVAIIVWLVG